MKSIKHYINEALKINSKSKVVNTVYNYFPKDKSELIDIIIEHFENKIYNLNDIDTSKITNMSNLFSCKKMSKYRSDTNEFELIDISKWDVSKVEYMRYMFYFSDFKQDVSDWRLLSVDNVDEIFLNI